MSVRLSVRLSVCLSVCPSVSLSVREHDNSRTSGPILLKFGMQVPWVMGRNPIDFERNRLTPGGSTEGGSIFAYDGI